MYVGSRKIKTEISTAGKYVLGLGHPLCPTTSGEIDKRLNIFLHSLWECKPGI